MLLKTEIFAWVTILIVPELPCTFLFDHVAVRVYQCCQTLDLMLSEHNVCVFKETKSSISHSSK